MSSTNDNIDKKNNEEKEISNNNNNDKNKKTSHAVPTMEMVLESVVRITIAGFGGALVGMSLSRRGGGAASAARGGMRHKNIVSKDVTQRWAGACMTFASLLELSRLSSPTSYIIDAVQEVVNGNSNSDNTNNNEVIGGGSSNNDDSINNNTYFNDKWTKRGITTIGDYAIGGAAAGLAFRDSPSSTARSIPGNVSSRLYFPARLGFGVCLGLIAGVLQFGVDYLKDQLEEKDEEDGKRGKGLFGGGQQQKSSGEKKQQQQQPMASGPPPQQQIDASNKKSSGDKDTPASEEIESNKSDDSFEIVESKKDEDKQKKKRKWYWFR